MKRDALYIIVKVFALPPFLVFFYSIFFLLLFTKAILANLIEILAILKRTKKKERKRNKKKF